ncbi:hypothetical protein BH10ACT1_BH10ACT1_34840 [soil metagenome]
MAKHRSPRRARKRQRHPYRVAAFLVVTALLAGATAVAVHRRVDERPARIAVRVQATGIDRWVSIDDGEPVAAALLAAGALGRDGRLLSARDGRVLDAHLDPATLRVDGQRVDPASVPVARDVVRLVDGTDRVEDTKVVEQVVPAPAMDDVLVHVTERGSAGRAEQVVGATSGDVVSTRQLLAPVAPRRTARKLVALTFDDGPNPDWTKQVLLVLKDKQVKATFCEIGEEVRSHPEISKAIVAAGHQLCNHTLGHDEGMRGAPQSQLDRQIGGGTAAFADAGLPAPAYFRPPGGFLDDAIKATVRGQDQQTLYWKVDTEDWRKGANPFSIVGHLLDEVDVGAIVLLHDGGGQREATVQALGPLIDALRAQGYQFSFPVIGRQ